MQCFNIPGPYDQYDLNMFFINMYLDHKERFRDNVKISSVFGNFPFCIWDGGRNFLRYKQCTKEEIQKISASYREMGIPVRLILTNPEIKEEHLYNRYCNMMVKECENDINEIVVNSPLLEQYIRENYPKYKIISSTTKRITSPDKFKDELINHDYYQVCLDYDLNKNKEMLESIPMEDRKKCEFLINAICPSHCPHRKEHYAKTGRYHLSFLKDIYDVSGCGIKESSVHPSVLGKNNNFTPEEIAEYEKMGFQYFKIEGRTLRSLDVLCMYCYYMIKPEWWFEVICEASNYGGITYNDNNAPVEMDLHTPRLYGMAMTVDD